MASQESGQQQTAVLLDAADHGAEKQFHDDRHYSPPPQQHHTQQQQPRQRQQQQQRNFDNSKNQCLGKRDKSSAGRIDPYAVEICGLINQLSMYYTTSSCAGRCFLYRGDGIKATTTFQRYRVSHDKIINASRYFDLSTLESDPTGGGDSIPTIGQYEHHQRQDEHHVRPKQQQEDDDENNLAHKDNDKCCSEDIIRAPSLYVKDNNSIHDTDDSKASPEEFIQRSTRTNIVSDSPQEKQKEEDAANLVPTGKADELDHYSGSRCNSEGQSVWLRYEPFILHVACRTMTAASALMSAARPAFKNVGLTTWKRDDSRYLVAIWGDEGIDMPLTTSDGIPLVATHSKNSRNHGTNDNNNQHDGDDDDDAKGALFYAWLAQLINERHERNWSKINRFVQAIRDMLSYTSEDENYYYHDDEENFDDYCSIHTKVPLDDNAPRSYDVIGDVALLYTISTNDTMKRAEIGNAIMRKNKSIKVVALRQANLTGTERIPGEDGIVLLAGTNRSPLITTHSEYGIKCVVDLHHTFFSSRMCMERLRLCQQVARGEYVLVLFAGVGMEAIQIAARTEAISVVAIEWNEIAIQCARRSHEMLQRNKAIQCPGAANRLEFVHGDVRQILPTLPHNYYHRIIVPRPKEGSLDGDLGTGEGGIEFLLLILPILKQNGGECHWYDFVADWEYPQCLRTKQLLIRTCNDKGLTPEFLNVAKVGSVAMRQFRICIDFRICLQNN